MDKKVDVDIAKKSLAILTDFCSRLNDISYKLAGLEELMMNTMDNNSIFISGSSQNTQNKFEDISSLTQCAFNNICIAYRLATECCNNEKNSISKQEINTPKALNDSLINHLSLLYDQISDYFSREGIKIIDNHYRVDMTYHNIGFEESISSRVYLLYNDFSLIDLVCATLYAADNSGLMKTNANVNNDVEPTSYVTFAHCGTVFNVFLNRRNEPTIIKVYADLPDNIVSLDYILKLYKEKTSKQK